MAQITVSELGEFLETVTGFPIGSLTSVHIEGGILRFTTTRHPITGSRDVGEVLIVGDPEPDPELFPRDDNPDEDIDWGEDLEEPF